MSMADSVVAEFGSSIGIDSLTLGDKGAVVLAMGRRGTLAIETLGQYKEIVLVSLTREVERLEEEACYRILESGFYRMKGHPIHVGLTARNALICAIRIHESEFTLAELNTAIEELEYAHATLESVLTLA